MDGGKLRDYRYTILLIRLEAAGQRRGLVLLFSSSRASYFDSESHLVNVALFLLGGFRLA
jgi:hypothetical protein